MYDQLKIPLKEDYLKGIQEYRNHERRDPMYKVASFLVETFWNNTSEMVDGLGVLLLTWNQAFYRYGSFDFDVLESFIIKNLETINRYRNRDIDTLNDVDNTTIISLFTELLDALKITTGKNAGRKSPVAVSKALHLLAPSFFPLWDDKISRGYDCHYQEKPEQKYLKFSYIIKNIKKVVKEYRTDKRTTLKLIDEYNYSKYTKKWI